MDSSTDTSIKKYYLKKCKAANDYPVVIFRVRSGTICEQLVMEIFAIVAEEIEFICHKKGKWELRFATVVSKSLLDIFVYVDNAQCWDAILEGLPKVAKVVAFNKLWAATLSSGIGNYGEKYRLRRRLFLGSEDICNE